MSELTRAVVGHGLTSDPDGPPADVLRAVKTFLLDTIGVGVAGRAAPLTDHVRRAASAWGAGDTARLLGGGRAVPATAAFVNAFQIHCQEFDCVHEGAVVHPMATIGAALLAEADARRVSGRSLASAIAVAVDIAAGLGIAAPSAIRFFRPATAGIFGATIGIARLRGFTEEQATNALGYALAFASGTMQAHVEGKPALPIQIGNAARGAIMAADLAQAGIEGPSASLDGPFGYLTLFEAEPKPDRLTELLGRRRLITQVSHKPFPTGRAAQGGIVLMQTLRRDIPEPEAVDRIVLKVPPLIERLVGRRAFEGMPANHARLCFPFLAALTIRNGTVALPDFSDEVLADRVLMMLAERVEVQSDGGDDPAAFTPQTAEVVLHDGTPLSASIDRLFGSPAHPLSREEHLQKFRGCVAFGMGEESGDVAEALIDHVEALEDISDVRVLTSLAAGEGSEP